jgi:hypothetical protein
MALCTSTVRTTLNTCANRANLAIFNNLKVLKFEENDCESETKKGILKIAKLRSNKFQGSLKYMIGPDIHNFSTTSKKKKVLHPMFTHLIAKITAVEGLDESKAKIPIFKNTINEMNLEKGPVSLFINRRRFMKK